MTEPFTLPPEIVQKLYVLKRAFFDTPPATRVKAVEAAESQLESAILSALRHPIEPSEAAVRAAMDSSFCEMHAAADDVAGSMDCPFCASNFLEAAYAVDFGAAPVAEPPKPEVSHEVP